MFVFLGLGNPGKLYANTRHNAGWLVLDELIHLWGQGAPEISWTLDKKLHAQVARISQNGHEILFLKPETFMNDSGLSALAAAKWYLHFAPESNEESLKNLVVFHDDLDMELGNSKLQFGSGPKIHNGVNSVRDHLGTNNFWAARIGVDSRGGDRSVPGKAYVLQPLTTHEKSLLQQVAKKFAEELSYVVLQ